MVLTAKDLLFVGLALVAVLYALTLRRGVVAMRDRRRPLDRGPEPSRIAPTFFQLCVGFVTVFFDTLGIGSFATTTAVFKLRRMVPVRLIPGTLNVGHALSTVVQALIYTRLVPVESTTLVLMIAAACIGSWLGVGVVVHLPRRKIQIGMGFALLIAAGLMLMTQLNLFPLGGAALGLAGPLLAIGLVGNFMLGMLMMIGIGLYAPCMILISLLGMNPTAAFPIMMGSCAFLMPTSSMRFVKSGAYHLQATLGLMLGGVPAVLIAAFLVRSLPLGAVRWLVVFVVVATALNMLFTVEESAGDLRADVAMNG